MEKNQGIVWRSILTAMLTLCLGLGSISIPASANEVNNGFGGGK